MPKKMLKEIIDYHKHSNAGYSYILYHHFMELAFNIPSVHQASIFIEMS